MKRFRKALSLLLAATLLLTAAACGSTAPASASSAPASSPDVSSDAPASGDTASDVKWPDFITVLGSAAGGMGTLYPQAIWQVLNEYLPTTGSVQVTAGSTQNLYLMEAGEAWMGFGSSVSAYNAMNGIEGFEKDPITDVKFMSMVDFSIVTSAYLARKGSGIKSFADLNDPNLKVDVGVAGSGAETQARNICKLFGLLDENGDYVFNAQYVSVTDATEMIQNNELDAILITTDGTIAELVATGKVDIFQMSEEEATAIAELVKGKVVTIPQDRFPQALENGPVFSSAFTSGFICREDADPDVVYEIVKAMWEHWDEIGEYNENLKNTDMHAIAYDPNSLIEYHPGALKFYKEQGLVK